MAIGMKEQKGSAKIKVSSNGPYLVSGNVPLAKMSIGINDKGESYEWRLEHQYPSQETYALCRCGLSKKKPFCDGEHIKAKFDGTETADRIPYAKEAKETDGPTLKLSEAMVFCASARFCHRDEGIWKLTAKSGDAHARKIAIEEGENCPSGTLVIWDKKTGKAMEPNIEPSIVLVEDPQKGVNGPIWVRGGITIEGNDGKPYEVRNRMTLCRCGKSANKPFCDSSHYPE